MSEPAEWWYSDIGDNMLKGVVDDPDNPPRLDDGSIVDFLRSVPEAVESFFRIYPTLLLEEQERLAQLAPFPLDNPIEDPQDNSDRFQHRWNTAGVRTTGPHGGTRRGGNE